MHCNALANPHSILERVLEKSNFAIMILNLSTSVIQELGYCIPSEGDCCHGMEELCAFIPQFYFVGHESISPIYVFLMKKVFQLSPDLESEIDFKIK
jgi:hypothetical protein